CVHFAAQSDERRKEAIRKTITRLQMDNNEKNELYEKLCSADHMTYKEIVQQMPVPDAAKERLIEVMG
ncbi:MAG: hypothetical protein K2O99_04245, partial [Lachnospiraceae bacterium]|nr:hypothetical protein [Lachnospiraceae bacterium]